MPTRWSSTTPCWHETRVRVARAPVLKLAGADLQPERPGDRSPSPHPSSGTAVVLSARPATSAAAQKPFLTEQFCPALLQRAVLREQVRKLRAVRIARGLCADGGRDRVQIRRRRIRAALHDF